MAVLLPRWKPAQVFNKENKINKGSHLQKFKRNTSIIFISLLWNVCVSHRMTFSCNQYLSECLSQRASACCQLAAGSWRVVTTLDLIVGRKHHFPQLFVASFKRSVLPWDRLLSSYFAATSRHMLDWAPVDKQSDCIIVSEFTVVSCHF